MKLMPVQARISALHISQERNHHARDQRHKARITHQMRKFAGEMHLDMFQVRGFERPIVRLMNMDQNRHHLTWAELSRTLSLRALLQLADFPLRRHPLNRKSSTSRNTSRRLIVRFL